MSDAASIALLILVIEVVIFVFALLILIVMGGVAVVESTALARRSLRQQGKRVEQANQAVEARVQRHVMDPVVRFERGYAWTRAFLRSMTSDKSEPSP